MPPSPSSPSQPWQLSSTTATTHVHTSIPTHYRIPPSLFPPSSLLDVTSFAHTSPWLTPLEKKITSSTAREILTKVREGTWTSETVTGAFLRRAGGAGELVSTVFFFF